MNLVDELFTKPEIKLFDIMEAHQAPFHLPRTWTKAMSGLYAKGAFVVHNNCARITPKGYELREKS